MLPSELRLLLGVRDALKSVAAGEPGAEIAAAIAAATIGVDELVLRHDRQFFAAHVDRAVSLAREGAALAGWGEPTGSDELDAVRSRLEQIVRKLIPREGSDPAIKEYLGRVVDWENELHATRVERAAAQSTPLDAPKNVITPQAIEQYLRGKFPAWGALEVSRLKTLAGGFSKTTVLFDAEDSVNGVQSLVIRAEQPVVLLFFEGSKAANEFRVLKLARRSGVRVAEPLWVEPDPSLVGGSFLVSRRGAGRNIGSAIGVKEEISPGLLQDLVDNLVRIHRTPIDPGAEDVRESHLGGWTRHRTLTELAEANIAYWREEIGKLDLPASPILVRTLEWLAHNVPECDEAPSLIHRDYGLHNILIDNDRVSCVLDWESATLGDPAEDLAWFAAGLKSRVDRRRILDLYAATTGRPVPMRRIRYYDVFNTLKYVVTCLNVLVLLERHREVPISACQLGLLYMYYYRDSLKYLHI